MTTTAAPPAPARRSGPTDRQWLIIGLCLVASVLILAVAVAVDHRAGGHTVSGPLDGRSAATFELTSGVGTVTVRTTDLGGDLYRISTPDGSGALPTVDSHGADVALRLDGSGGDDSVRVLLNRTVRWQVRLAAGAQDATLDLGAGRVSTVDITAGLGRLDLTLPGPQGTVPVHLTSGAGSATVHAPPGTPVRTRLDSGAGTVTLDGQAHPGVGAGSAFTLGDYDHAGDRYDLEFGAGVGALTVSRG